MSGLLSHTAQRSYPNLHVVYNDYDNFRHRLASVESTNTLLAQIRQLLSTLPKFQKIDADTKQLILGLIHNAARRGHWIDYITLSSSLLFSGKFATTYEELARETFYNCIKKADYQTAGYLDGLEVVSTDYKILYNTYRHDRRVLFVVDPPYLSTDTSSYHSDKYWRLKDYLDVLTVLSCGRYIYFTSNKSSILDLCDWFSTTYHMENPFAGATLKTYNASINQQAKYTDMMLSKFQPADTIP